MPAFLFVRGDLQLPQRKNSMNELKSTMAEQIAQAAVDFEELRTGRAQTR